MWILNTTCKFEKGSPSQSSIRPVFQIPAISNSTPTTQLSSAPIVAVNMTKKIPAENGQISDITFSASPNGVEAAVPDSQAQQYFITDTYPSLSTLTSSVNEVLDLSTPTLTLRDPLSVITPTSMQSFMQDLQSPADLTSSSESTLALIATDSSSTLTSQLLEDESDLDPSLAQAAFTAAQTGILTPLVKEELRCTIQSKRLQKGKPELVTEERQPVSNELTEEDLKRRERRRERNKVAAQKCRNKRKSRLECLEQETQELESNNKGLKRQIQELEIEREKLSLLLTCHDTSSHHCPQRRKLSESFTNEEAVLSKMFDEISKEPDDDIEATFDMSGRLELNGHYTLADNINDFSNVTADENQTVVKNANTAEQVYCGNGANVFYVDPNEIDVMDVSVVSEEIVVASADVAFNTVIINN